MKQPAAEDLPAPIPAPQPAPIPSPQPSPPPSIHIPTQLTVLSMTDGNVFVMKSGTDTWMEAQVGMTLEIGDTIKADDNSSAEITFFEGSTIGLEAGTEIAVAALDLAKDTGTTTILLKQEIGKTISRVTKLADSASRYEVETPAVVAAVRGSNMVVYVGEDGTTFICNIRGLIWAIAQGVELQIPEGVCGFTIPGHAPQLQSPPDGGGGGSVPRTGYGGQ